MAGIDKILLGGSTIFGIEDEENRKEVEKLKNPEFSDTGNVAGITSFPDFLAKVKSKMDIFGFFRDFKAGMQFILHTGQIVNNCVSDRTDLPLAAKQGKILAEELAKLNSDLTAKQRLGRNGMCFVTIREPSDAPSGFGYCSGLIVHRGDTLSVILFDRLSSKMAVNSWISNKENQWTGWEKSVTTSELQKYPQKISFDISLNSQKIIHEGYNRFTQLLCIQGTTSNCHGIYALSGYGNEGGTNRYHVDTISNGADISVEINGVTFVIKNNSNNTSASCTLMLIQGDTPDVS